MQSILILVLLALLFPGYPAGAQEAKADHNAQRSCRLVFPERRNDMPKVAYLFDGENSREVALPSMNLSDVIALPGGEITILMTPVEITDPGNPPADAPSLKIPEGIRNFYIHVTPDPNNAMLPLRMNLVDIGNGMLKPGETLWYNLTDHLIAAKLEESEMTIPPKGQTVSKAPLPDSGYYSAEFTYQTHGEGEFHKITEQQWWHDAKSRHIGFIADSGGKLPKIYFYRDFRE